MGYLSLGYYFSTLFGFADPTLLWSPFTVEHSEDAFLTKHNDVAVSFWIKSTLLIRVVGNHYCDCRVLASPRFYNGNLSLTLDQCCRFLTCPIYKDGGAVS